MVKAAYALEARMTRRLLLKPIAYLALGVLLAAAKPLADKPNFVPKYGPPGHPYATALSKDHEYFQSSKHPASDFWALIPYYVPQFNDASCSVASVVNVINAIIAQKGDLGNDVSNVTQAKILDLVTAQRWKAHVTAPGYLGQFGLTLDQLAQVTKASLTAFGINQYTVESAQIQDDSATSLSQFRELLVKNERSADDFVMIHFVQDEVTRAPGGPFAHISPIGAYDAKNRKVLVLDVDREWYEPYWVSDEIVLHGCRFLQSILVMAGM